MNAFLSDLMKAYKVLVISVDDDPDEVPCGGSELSVVPARSRVSRLDMSMSMVLSQACIPDRDFLGPMFNDGIEVANARKRMANHCWLAAAALSALSNIHKLSNGQSGVREAGSTALSPVISARLLQRMSARCPGSFEALQDALDKAASFSEELERSLRRKVTMPTELLLSEIDKDADAAYQGWKISIAPVDDRANRAHVNIEDESSGDEEEFTTEDAVDSTDIAQVNLSIWFAGQKEIINDRYAAAMTEEEEASWCKTRRLMERIIDQQEDNAADRCKMLRSINDLISSNCRGQLSFMKRSFEDNFIRPQQMSLPHRSEKRSRL